MAVTETEFTVASYISTRLKGVGIKECFTVPGDYNLELLDKLFTDDLELSAVCCPSELIAGYASDGYARGNGIGCLITIFNVGTLAASTAIAGARSSRLPLIVIAGTMNSKDVCSGNSVHHSIGKFAQDTSINCLTDICVFCCRIDSLTNANLLIDEAFHAAIRKRGPVYIELCCDLVNGKIPAPMDIGLDVSESSLSCLDKSTDDFLMYWSNSQKPIVLLGANIAHVAISIPLLQELVQITGCPIALEPNARYYGTDFKTEIGVYWGPLSTPHYISELLNEADLVLGIGLTATDYLLKDYTLKQHHNMVHVGVNSCDLSSTSVVLPSGCIYNHVSTSDFLKSVISKLRTSMIPPKYELFQKFQTLNRAHGQYFGFSLFRQPSWAVKKHEILMGKAQGGPECLDGYESYQVWLGNAVQSDQKLENLMIAAHVQAMLSSKNTLILDCGSAWFLSRNILLPKGCDLQMQLQYGSIGWSLGATLGYSMACKGKKRVICIIGDGALQMTCQSFSTIFSNRLNPIIIILNNSNYAIEDAIHAVPFNKLDKWRFCDLAKSIQGNTVGCIMFTASKECEFSSALLEALKNESSPAIIELLMDSDYLDESMISFGSLVSDMSSNGSSASTSYPDVSSGDLSKSSSYRSSSKLSGTVKLFDATKSFQNFAKLKLLGKGGVGKVYLVVEKDSFKLYAIKALSKQEMIVREKVNRVFFEKNALITLNHPFIVPLYHCFQSLKTVYLCMEYCGGGDLYTLLQKSSDRRLPEELAKFYVSEIVSAFEYIHLEGYLYRDLKPENILITVSGHIMLTDFDLSKQKSEPQDPKVITNSKYYLQINSDATFDDYKTNTFVGTQEYISPELLQGSGYSAALDWWTLGILLYEMLYGYTPFSGKNQASTYRNILRKDPSYKIKTGVLKAKITAEAKNFIHKLLIKDHTRRLGSKFGSVEVKGHPFFKGINFNLLLNNKPPFVPSFKHRYDTSNFKEFDENTTISNLFQEKQSISDLSSTKKSEVFSQDDDEMCWHNISQYLRSDPNASKLPVNSYYENSNSTLELSRIPSSTSSLTSGGTGTSLLGLFRKTRPSPCEKQFFSEDDLRSTADHSETVEDPFHSFQDLTIVRASRTVTQGAIKPN